MAVPKSVSFAPASIATTVKMSISGRYDFGDGVPICIVSSLQLANHSIEFFAQSGAGSPWQSIGKWEAYPVEQRVGVSVEAASRVKFARSVNTPYNNPSGLVRFKGNPEVYTDKWVRVEGVNYRLVRVGPDNAQFPMFKLVQ
jgi:hypothetical protein